MCQSMSAVEYPFPLVRSTGCRVMAPGRAAASHNYEVEPRLARGGILQSLTEHRGTLIAEVVLTAILKDGPHGVAHGHAV